MFIGLAALIVTLICGIFFWWGLKQWRIEQAVAATRSALIADDVQKIVSGLRLLNTHDSNHPLLPVFRAQFYSRYAPRLAPPFWEQAIDRHPEDLEIRTAYALNLVGIGELERAEKQVRAWLTEDAEASAHLRAALAVAFAQKNFDWARDHAGRLSELEPDSTVNRINQAALELSTGTGEEQAAAMATLKALLENPESGIEALRLLLQFAIRQQDLALFNQLRSMKAIGGSEADTLFLEAASQMGQEPDRNLVRQLWHDTAPGSLKRSRLGGWLVNQGLGEWMMTLAEQEPDRWQFPEGLPLAEAHLQAGQVSDALDGLSKVEWPGLEYLHFFVRARLAAGVSETASKTFLRLALKQTGNHESQWEHLYATARTWGWRDGMVGVARYAVQHVSLTSPHFRFWIEQVTSLRDAEGLLTASKRFLEKNPNHVPSLNNAAYCAFLQKRNLDEALARSRHAYDLAPDAAGVRSSLLFLEIERGNIENAKHLLDELSVHDPYRWLGQLYLAQKLGKFPDPKIQEQVRQHTYFWPEEELLKRDLLKI